MKSRVLIRFALILVVCSLVWPAGASAEEVKLDGASFQEVLNKLFGTPETTGLLDGDKNFSLHAKELSLTAEEANLFFVPSEANTSDFADLISATEEIKGQLKLEGVLLDGDSFSINIAGKQVKVEGLVLTQEEFDALVAELQGIPSLKQAKITATVDGKLLIAKLENQPGRLKIEDKGTAGSSRKPESSGNGNLRADASNGKPEKVERPEKPERSQRPERIERIERASKR